MDPHDRFKAGQTAAVYVANQLDHGAREEFEMHMMDCRECAADVEAWRAIQRHMPPSRQPRSARGGFTAAWRLAAALVIATLAAAGGWLARALQAPGIDSRQTVFFNLPPLSRGGDDCTELHLSPANRTAILRVAGVSRDRQLMLVDLLQRPIPPSRYRTWQQPDGSHVLALDAAWLAGKSLSIEARAPDGFGEPLGCVTGVAAASR